MRWNRMRGVLVCISLVLAMGCMSRYVRSFYHVSDRERYAITDAELEDLGFFISRDVIVQGWGKPGDPPEGGILLKGGTSGVLREAGPNWIKVSFEKDGAGVAFLADDVEPEDNYWLATELGDRPGFHKVKDLPEHILLFEGRRYIVVQGADAVLYVGRRDIERLLKSRRRILDRQRTASGP